MLINLGECYIELFRAVAENISSIISLGNILPPNLPKQISKKKKIQLVL